MKNNEYIMCPLIESEISDIQCMENTSLKEEFIPEEFKNKNNWKDICKHCKYHDY